MVKSLYFEYGTCVVGLDRPNLIRENVVLDHRLRYANATATELSELSMLTFLISKKWRPYLAHTPVVDINGNRIEGPVMRRRNGSIVEYRELIEGETVEDQWIGSIRD
ncbi:hypothetical protein [Rhizobium sp. BR 362]|uniref:hypothetical protein n=1 Tax=Rhizobium sp. BR 362 TaxID=3040670 RepID=UPI002F3E2D79